MKKYDVIIIGAGASGCMCALSCKDKKIAIVDAGKSMAKKIMVTGNGRCNLTNINMNSSYFNQNIDVFLRKFDEKRTLRFFEKLGMVMYSDNEGRVYPYSNSAKSVVDVLNFALKNKVDFFAEHEVEQIIQQNNGFLIKTNNGEMVASKVVVATGGGTLAQTIKCFGIKCKKSFPSLVALKCDNVKDLNGLKVSDVKVTAITKSGRTATEMGEVLFKEKGLSGIAIFNLSALFAREEKFEGKIKIDLVPKMNIGELQKFLRARCNLNVSMDKFFVGMFQNAISNEIFVQCKFNTNKNSANLTDLDIEKIANTIKSLTFNVVDCYDNNQVVSGGVLLSELDENLMSKKIPGLYFVGEVVDVDGVCGGYNLQWAWTSGAIVGRSL